MGGRGTKKYLLAGVFLFSVLLLAMLGAQNALAVSTGFQYYYEPSNWTEFTDGNGVVIANNQAIKIIGSGESGKQCGIEANPDVNCDTDFFIVIPCDGSVVFDWYWANQDENPDFDQGGYLINGAFTRIDNVGTPGLFPENSLGSKNVPVSAGDIFGFRVLSDDDLSGDGSLTIFEFSAPLSCRVANE